MNPTALKAIAEAARRLGRFVEGETPRTVYAMPPNGRFDPMRADVLALLSEIEEKDRRIEALEKALEPFAERCSDTFSDDADSSGLTVKVGYLRQARAALGHAPAPSIAAWRAAPGETVVGDVRPPDLPSKDHP